MAVSEICITGKVGVFVPYPFAAEDHQTFNAMQLVNKGAALMVKDSEVNEKLLPTLMQLIQDDEAVVALQKNIKSFALVNADEIIAKEIIEYISK